MTYRINYSLIANQSSTDGRLRALEDEIDRADYICLTDAVLNLGNCGELMMEWLGTEEKNNTSLENRRNFKIKILTDEWGNEVLPGEYLVRKKMKPLVDIGGRKLRSNAINDMKRCGTFDKQYIEERKFKVDKDGCITCGFEDAGWFLSEYGVNFDTDPKQPVCGRKEFSGGPCKAPDGKMKITHYWRYEEVPPWTEEKKEKQNKRK